MPTDRIDDTKFYSIKYLATSGIQEFMGHDFTGYATTNKQFSSGGYKFERIGKDAFRTRPEAVAAAIKAYDKKIVSAQKALARLEKGKEKLLAG